MSEADLTLVWAGILAFAVFAYVVLDGFDLGIGILFLALKAEDARTDAANAIAPVWDGNETWLVLGGAGLMSAFPVAYAILLPALYAPLVVMLLGLVFRGVAFEFRTNDPRHRPVWDIAFAAGSIAATFAQGVMAGAMVQGIATRGLSYAGGWWDWLTPFTLCTGAALVVGYSWLGAAWLAYKAEGEIQSLARNGTRLAAAMLLVLITILGAWLIHAQPRDLDHWDAASAIALGFVLLCTGGTHLWTLANRRDGTAFLTALILVALLFVALARSFYPLIIPPSLTIWQTHAPGESMSFVLIGAGILIPVILIYTGHAYWTFRGKVVRLHQ